MRHCPVCHQQIPDDDDHCPYCGGLSLTNLEPIDPSTTVQIGHDKQALHLPRWGDAYLAGEKSVCLQDMASEQTVAVSFQGRSSVILGRASSEEEAPTALVDLSRLNARQLGVSRHHVQLDVQRNIVYITDLGSTNATYLNGHRLVAHQQRILRDGDELELGDLRLRVGFQETPESIMPDDAQTAV